MWPIPAPSRPLIFAHRGGAALEPENTMCAFERGMALGADGLELDVRLSRDGRVVVHHDDRLDRTTDGQGRVASFTADELLRLDAGCRFTAGGPGPVAGQPRRAGAIRIPLLCDVLDRFRNALLIIELKGSDPGLARAVVEEIRRADAMNRVCLAGYSRRALRAARNAEPSIATSAAREDVRWALYRSWFNLSPGRVPYRAFQVPEIAGRTRIVSPRFLRLAHKAGLPVQVWTVDTGDEVARLLAWGVDAIISDRPDIAVPVRDALFNGHQSER